MTRRSTRGGDRRSRRPPAGLTALALAAGLAVALPGLVPAGASTRTPPASAGATAAVRAEWPAPASGHAQARAAGPAKGAKSKGGTSKGGTSKGGTSKGGTSKGGTSKGGKSKGRTVVTASGASFAGYGGSLRAWGHAFHRDVSACTEGSCFGPKDPALGHWRYFDVTTTRGRVSGWSEVLPPRTTIAQAQVAVLGLFPADVQLSKLMIQRKDLFGSSCAFLDVQSKTLARWFGPRSLVANDGRVGIELAELTASGFPAYAPADTDLVLVVPRPWGQADNC